MYSQLRDTTLASSAIPVVIDQVEAGTTQTGFVVLTPDSESAVPSASLTYGLVSNAIVQSQAAVLPTALSTDAWLPLDEVSTFGRNLGFAIANLADSQNRVDFTLVDQSGSTVVFVGGIVLEPFLQRVFLAREIVPSNFLGDSFVGSLKLESFQQLPFATLALRFNGAAFSTVPVGITSVQQGFPMRNLEGSSISTGGPIGGSDALVFPQFAMGGGWASQIRLLNPTDSIITGRIDIFERNGTPTAAILNGRESSTFTYAIPAGGTVTLAPRDANGQTPM